MNIIEKILAWIFGKKTSAPVIEPNGGRFEEEVSVRISSKTQGAEITFTTDGSEPKKDSEKYASEKKFTKSLTLKAKAFSSGMKDSSTSSANFEIVPKPLDPVPERKGENEYVGNGELNTWKILPGGRNPSKKVILASWVKINSWPVPKEGANIINKGSVGNSWAYGLAVRPTSLVYKATDGDVFADFKFLAKKWYYVKVEATKNTAKFFVDGKEIPVTKKETDVLFSNNEHPLRIGGMAMGWTPPSPWFNGSLDGEMSDYTIDIS